MLRYRRSRPPIADSLMKALMVTAVICVAMSVFKLIFCALAPEALTGPAGWEIEKTIFLLGLMFLVVGFIAMRIGRVVRPALLFLTLALYLLFAVGSVRGQLTIFHVGRDFGLVDAHMARWDAFLGFGWIAYFEWVASRPALHWVLAQAYHSIWFQPFLLMVLFVASRNIREFAKLQIALPLSFLMVCCVATFLPALGAYQFHGMTPDRHPGIPLAFTDEMTAPLLWLRQADLPTVMPDFPELRIVQFPSWHAATATIFVLSAWGQPIVRWISLALNGLMLAATPVQGSHYLSDLMIGCALGGLAFALAAWILRDRPSVGIAAPAPLTAFAKPRAAGIVGAN